MKGLTLSVSQLNEYVRKSLAADPMLRGLCLRGELSNLKRHISGHWYFSLKDSDAAINCAMFRQSAQTVRFVPQNGMQVRLFGSVGLYGKTGSYQFYADAMEQDGMGELFLRFEALKERLSSEGLFDTALKKPIPLLPKGIGIITSKTGAVLHDIARVAWRRYPGMPLYLCPVKVQGDGAAEEITHAIRLMNQLEEVDVLILGRGGGSMEDLWPFNEEIVARAAAACNKPLISAVGHETDFTIIDFVADLRAPTPSAAAELAVPERDSLSYTLSTLEERMTRAFESAISTKRLRLSVLEKRLDECGPMRRGERMLARIAAAGAKIEASMAARLAQKRHALENAALRIKAAGPTDILRRGYAIISHKGRAVRHVDELAAGNELFIRMADGSVTATVNGIEREDA